MFCMGRNCMGHSYKIQLNINNININLKINKPGIDQLARMIDKYVNHWHTPSTGNYKVN